MVAKFIDGGAELKNVSMMLLQERLVTVAFQECYEYLDVDGIGRVLHIKPIYAKEIAETCTKRGGRWRRASPNAPHVKELEQFWVCTKSSEA